MADNHEQDAANLSFDLTKQFITLAIGGIAFVVGLSYSSPSAVSSVLLWLTVLVFGLSAVFGLFFLMHGVNTLSVQKSYNIYATSLRFLAGFQIVMVLIGVVLLCPILYNRASAKHNDGEAKTIKIQLSAQQTISCPIENDKSYTIEIENGKVKFSSTK